MIRGKMGVGDWRQDGSSRTANPTQPCYGLILNGSDFVFVKLNREETPPYATSRVFSLLAPGNELVEVLKILKHLAQLVVGG